MSTRPDDEEEIVDLLARVKDFCASVRRGPHLGLRDTAGRSVDDEQLLGVGQMEMIIAAIECEITVAGALERATGADRERILAMSAGHRIDIDVCLAKLEGLLYQAKANRSAFGLSVDLGRIRAQHSKGGQTTGDALHRGAYFTRKKVEDAVREARAAGVKDRKLVSEVVKRTGLARSTVLPYLKK